MAENKECKAITLLGVKWFIGFLMSHNILPSCWLTLIQSNVYGDPLGRLSTCMHRSREKYVQWCCVLRRPFGLCVSARLSVWHTHTHTHKLCQCYCWCDVARSLSARFSCLRSRQTNWTEWTHVLLSRKKPQEKPGQFPHQCAEEESQMNKITDQLCNGIQFSMPSVHSNDIF